MHIGEDTFLYHFGDRPFRGFIQNAYMQVAVVTNVCDIVLCFICEIEVRQGSIAPLKPEQVLTKLRQLGEIYCYSAVESFAYTIIFQVLQGGSCMLVVILLILPRPLIISEKCKTGTAGILCDLTIFFPNCFMCAFSVFAVMVSE